MQPKSSSASNNSALVLMALSGLLNYVDRGTISIAGTNIQGDLHLTNYQLGLLLSAFFWTYGLSQLCYVAGWIADRFNVCWVLAGGVALWSIATGACGLANSFTMMFALRLLLGAGESVSYPSYSRIIVNCFPEHRRGLSNATIDAGTKLGPAIGALAGGFLIVAVGWRAFFVVLGIATFLWIFPWMKWMPRSQRLDAGSRIESTPGFAQLFAQPKLWWTALALFCSNYFWYFLITWLPPYLEKERGFPKQKMAVVSALAYLAIAGSSIAAGWLSDFWIAKGGAASRVRKTFAGVGLGLATSLVAVAVVDDPRIAMGVLMFACVSFGLYSSNTFAISQTLAGPGAAGRWTGVQNGFGNLAGVAAPWFTGWVVDHSGHFYVAFLAATLMALVSGLVYVFAIGRIEPVSFRAM
jgi:MFS transporter, ACS family, D-galactonate transporter